MAHSMAAPTRAVVAASALVRPSSSGGLCYPFHVACTRNAISPGFLRCLLPHGENVSVPTNSVGNGGGWPFFSSPAPLVSCRSGGTVDFSSDFLEEEEVGENVVPAAPASEGRIDIVVTKEAIRQLDLSAAHAVFRKFVHQVGDNATAPSSDPKELLGRTVGFVLQYERDDPFDPRELSEMPDIRLWFVRLDVTYPWLPVVLDWRAGELSRYAAMLVPHQMSKRQGLVFNPEALELFAMSKVFLLYSWLRVIGIPKPKQKVDDMLKMLGFTLTDQLYCLIEEHPPP